MTFLFTAPSPLPALHLDDSLWPVAPWQWLGAHQGPIEPLKEEDGWEPMSLLKSVSLMEPNSAIISPSEALWQFAGNDARVEAIDGTNKAKQPKSGLSITSMLPHWNSTLLSIGAPALALNEDVTECAHIHSATNINFVPSNGQQPSTLLDPPQVLPNSLETKVLSDVGVPTYPSIPSLQVGHVSEHNNASLQLGMEPWSSSIAQEPATMKPIEWHQEPATMKPIEWHQEPKANLAELQRLETNSSLHTRQYRQVDSEHNTNLWNNPPAYPDAQYTRDDGPMQVHFHQPLIGHMQVQGTTPQDVRLFKEQVEEALVAIFNNVKTMYP